MTPNIRSYSGAALMLVIIPIFAGLLACMPVPVGDPERSRVDPDLNGVWRMSEPGGDRSLIQFRPYDKRTWLVIGTGESESGSGPVTVYKAWLAKLGAKKFMNWEQMGSFSRNGSFVPEFWYVFRVEKDHADQFALYMIDMEFEGFEGIPGLDEYDGDNYARDMRRTWERAIKRDADNEDMYGEALVLHRLADGELADALDQFEKVIELD